MKLNLGCGKDYRQGYINADISDAVGADIIFDVEEGIPYPENKFDNILVNNVLTQILFPNSFVSVMNELWRVCSGTIEIRVPLVTNQAAWQDPYDCRRFTEQSFTYMEEGHRRYEQYGKHYGFMPFKVNIIENNGIQIRLVLTPVK